MGGTDDSPAELGSRAGRVAPNDATSRPSTAKGIRTCPLGSRNFMERLPARSTAAWSSRSGRVRINGSVASGRWVACQSPCQPRDQSPRSAHRMRPPPAGSPVPRPRVRRGRAEGSTPRHARPAGPWRCGPGCARASVVAAPAAGRGRTRCGCWRTGRSDAMSRAAGHRAPPDTLCPVGGNLDRRDPGRADGPFEEPAGSVPVASCGDEYVDDLPELVDRPVAVAPAPGDLHVGRIDLPAVTDGMAAGPGGLGEQRGEALHPPVDGDMVDLDAALGEELLDVAVRQRETQVPAHRQHDHLGREAEASQGRPREGGAEAARAHGHSLPTRASHTAGATVPARLGTRCLGAGR